VCATNEAKLNSSTIAPGGQFNGLIPLEKKGDKNKGGKERNSSTNNLGTDRNIPQLDA
jgi:hypothetical protein